MTRTKPAPGVEALEAVQRGRAGDAGNDTVAVCDYTTMLLQSPCPCCDYPGPHRVNPDTPPHYQRLSCGACGHWLRWLSQPPSVAQGGRP